MISKWKVSAIVSGLLFLLFSPFHNVSFAESYSLSGSVKDSSGNAIPNSAVSVNDASSASTVTDSTGAYNLTIEEGSYNIQVTAPSGSSYSSAIALNQAILESTVLNFILVQTGTVTLTGRVLDRDNQPLDSQSVGIAPSGTNNYTFTTTDSSGNYSFSTSPGDYKIRVSGNNPLTASAPPSYSITSSGTLSLTQSIIMDIQIPTKQVTVHVQDANGTAQANVGLFTNSSAMPNIPIGIVTNATGTSSYSSALGLTTDVNGDATMWLFKTPPSGNRYTITATPPIGSSFTTTNLSSVAVIEDGIVTLTLQEPVTLTGRVLDRDNQPLDSQSVGIAPSGTNNYTFTTTDSSGNYSFSTSPGDYKIRVSGNNPLIASAPPSYSITSSGTLSLTVDTTMDIPIPAKRVTVIVQDVAGQAIQNVTISTNSISMPNIPIGIVTNATGTSSYSSSLGLTTDSSGSATLWLFQTPNSGNRYTITATPPVGSNFVAKSLSPVAVPGDTNLLITMVRPLTFSGQVLDGLGNPLPGQIVSIAPPGTGNYTDSITDANGYYNFSVTSGEYIIKVQGDNEINTDAPANYSIQSSEVLLLADDTVMDIPLPVKRVSIHIQNEINDPIQDVELVTNDLPMPNIPIGTISNATGVSSYNALDGLISDSSGNATMWLFSTPPSGNRYTISATPPEGGIYNPFSLSGIEVTANQTEIIALQYNHEQPITTATLSPAPNSNGDYLNSATVTLSATAAEGHTIANTYYKVDGGTQQTYSAPFEVTGDGLHTVNYWSVDDSGVVEVQKTASFNIVNTHSLSGTVYLDANENGFQDVGEDGYEGALITLDSQDSDTTDANGNYSFADLETGVYEVALTIPSEYIATTTNPATISLNDNTTQNFGIAPEVTATPTPTVTPTPAEFTPVADTYIKQGSQNENEGSSTFIRLQSSGHNRGLVSFDESAIEAYIGQSQNYTAKLQFTITDNGNNWGNDGRTIDVHRALNGWVEGNGFIVGNSPSDRGTGSGVTWNCSVDTETSNQNDDCGGTTAWDMTNSSNWPFISTPTATATINSNQTGVVEFDVTSDVASFVAGTNQNYGWVIKKTNEGQNGRVEFGSKESSYAPKLIITLN